MQKIILLLVILLAAKANAQKPYRLEGNEIKTDKQVLFQTGTAILKPESNEALLIIKGYLDEKTYISLLRVEGHTDGDMPAAKQQQLSEDRALAVCKKLVEMGVDCKRLIAVGFGNNKPIADNTAAEGRSQNQRIVFINAALRGHNIGGQEPAGGGKTADQPVCQ